MTEGVIHFLEVIEVDEQDGDLTVVAFRALECMRQAGIE